MRAAAADWSGAATGESRHLWLAEWDDEGGGLTSLRRASRRDVGVRLLALAEADADLTVGLDFNFSMPAWWLRKCGISSAPELWADQGRLEDWLAACDPPFWGRPGRHQPGLPAAAQFRRTELACVPRPRSVFQIGGAGAVGTASLRGMPVLDRLRRAGFSVWPFDRDRRPVVAEVWPRLAIGSLVKSRPEIRANWAASRADRIPAAMARMVAESDDAFDAVAAVMALAHRASDLRPDIDDEVIALEGWIDGVAWPPPPAAPPPQPG